MGPGIVFVHPGIVYNVFSMCIRAFVPLSAPCDVRVGHPLVLNGTQNYILSCSVCVFAVWRACKAPSRVQLPAAYTTPSKRETKKSLPLAQSILLLLYRARTAKMAIISRNIKVLTSCQYPRGLANAGELKRVHFQPYSVSEERCFADTKHFKNS